MEHISNMTQFPEKLSKLANLCHAQEKALQALQAQSANLFEALKRLILEYENTVSAGEAEKTIAP